MIQLTSMHEEEYSAFYKYAILDYADGLARAGNAQPDVFGHNIHAQALYEKMGYAAVSMTMAKKVYNCSSVETMSSHQVVADFLDRKAWHLVQYIDLGTAAHLFVVEKDNERHVLKIQRDGNSDTSALQTEYQVLQCLSTTAMQPYVPRVGEWLPELAGFLMEYLRYPTQAERDAPAWAPSLAQALGTLHSISLPAIQGIADDRPEIGAAIRHRFRSMFEVVRKEDDFWTRLPREDKSKFELVRAHYQTYIGLLPRIENTLAHTRLALTHGDLAGDNIMLTQDGRLAITDWGAARISSALTDVAHLLTYANWPGDEEHRFLNVYFGDDLASLEGALPCLQVLSRLYRYHSCVQSLLWLNEIGEEGLDAVGRAHFERVLGAL